jgi:PAS domain S-box-containing protein
VGLESVVKQSDRYLAALILVSLAAACRFFFLEHLDVDPTITFYPAIIAASLLGGFFPGLFAVTLSALMVDFWWIEPAGNLQGGTKAGLLSLGLFSANSLFICATTELIMRVRRRTTLLETASLLEEERRSAIEAMFKQQVLLERMSQLAKVGGWCFDVETMSGEWTEEAAQIHDCEDIKDINVVAEIGRYRGESRHQIEQAIQDAVEHGKPYELELEMVTATGRSKWVRTHGQPIERDGKVVRIEGAIQDITEHKLAVLALQKSETALQELNSFYRQIIDNLGEGIVVHDDNLHYTLWNRFMEDVTGIDSGEVIGRHPREVFTCFQGSGTLERIRQALRGAPPAPIEQPYNFARSGRAGWFLDKSMLMQDKTGRITGAINILHDITEERIIEEKLENEKNFTENTFNNLKDTFLVMDLEGRIIKWNKALSTATGYTDLELAGLGHADLTTPDYLQLQQETISKVLRHGSASMEGVLLTREGQTIPYEYAGSLLCDSMGEAIGITVTGRDISERKTMEKQLIHSQKMEAIGTLAGGIAHDFNNLLTVISGYGNLMQMKMAEDTPLRNELDQILAASEKAAFLVNRLLTFSRKLEINLTNVNLPDIVRNLEKFLARIIGEDIQLSVSVDEETLFVKADINQIEQILMNLATNARDAMPDGGTLDIELGRAVLDGASFRELGFGRAGTYALIAVRDNGQGIDSETQQHIFEPYFTTKDLGKGTGLGLPIVYGIVKQHGGYITVESTEGQGATFRIFIPLLEQSQELDQRPSLNLQPGRETILLAEDEESVRKILNMMLSSLGYNVIEACNGLEAIEVFKTQRDTIDLLLFDIVMPEMNGMTAYKEICKCAPRMKVLFMSGYPADGIFNRSDLPEHAAVIAKPIQNHELASRIRQLFATADTTTTNQALQRRT